MKQGLKIPISETALSTAIGRTIKSPIRVSNLMHLGIDTSAFIDFFRDKFNELNWDPYDYRRQQVLFLIDQFPQAEEEILKLHKPYFVGDIKINAFAKWIFALTPPQLYSFELIKPWRRRSVSQFILTEEDGKVKITRELVPDFVQKTNSSDYRTWPRKFMESPKDHVENELFNSVLTKFFHLTRSVRANVSRLKITAHFMSVQSTTIRPGNNSPEGAHEDGVDYIVSALVINRQNLEGGESQIIEQLEDGHREIIYSHILEPGEFIFQADTKDEIVYGTDLWHHVTPFYLSDPKKKEGWRDIIGFDIEVL